MEAMKMKNNLRESIPGAPLSENPKTVVLTGASSGIGRAIARRLLECGYKVYGVGRDFGEEIWPHGFHKLIIDMKNTGSFYDQIRGLLKRENICGLINNAGAAYYGLHETLNPAKIHEMVTVNLEIPMVLSQLALRDLKKNRGHIINISSVTAKQTNPHGCAYGATKAGLSSFSASLFDENRKYGVHVCTIHPDMVKTNLYRNADFCQGEDEMSYLTPQQVADAVMYVLSVPESMSVTDITLRPQKHQIRRK